MRYINKESRKFPQLDAKNQIPPKTSKEATSRWRNLKFRPMLLRALLDEQLNVCCYTELHAEDYNYTYHIEHVLNKSKFPELTFEYQNLAASALSSLDLGVMKNTSEGAAFGGHAPEKSYSVDVDLFITPHQINCEKFFYYLSDGEVTPAKNLNESEVARAKYTIKCLNLNSQFLVSQRKYRWDELNDALIKSLSDEEALKRLAELYCKSTDGSLKSFCSMSTQMFGRLMKNI